MTMLDILVPAEQEGTRAQVLRWLKQPGEPVLVIEPIVELETDKVTVEVAAPGSGVLREILKQEQEQLAPGDVLGRIEPGATAEVLGQIDPSAVASAQSSVPPVRSVPPVGSSPARSAGSGRGQV